MRTESGISPGGSWDASSAIGVPPSLDAGGRDGSGLTSTSISSAPQSSHSDAWVRFAYSASLRLPKFFVVPHSEVTVMVLILGSP
jgi:hypothetical protein